MADMSFDDDADDMPGENGRRLFSVLELIWGEGWVTPGGPEDVDRLVEGTDLRDKRVVDLGSGTGALGFYLIEKHMAAHVTGLEDSTAALNAARQSASARGLAEAVDFVAAGSGTLPFGDGQIDVVISKDGLDRFQNKSEILREISRVLTSGGMLLASCWISGEVSGVGPQQGPMGETLHPATDAQWRRALDDEGFVDVRIADRSDWYRQVGRNELASMQGDIGREAARSLGEAAVDHFVGQWEARLAAMDKGEIRPAHIRARKP